MSWVILVIMRLVVTVPVFVQAECRLAWHARRVCSVHKYVD